MPDAVGIMVWERCRSGRPELQPFGVRCSNVPAVRSRLTSEPGDFRPWMTHSEWNPPILRPDRSPWAVWGGHEVDFGGNREVNCNAGRGGGVMVYVFRRYRPAP